MLRMVPLPVPGEDFSGDPAHACRNGRRTRQEAALLGVDRVGQGDDAHRAGAQLSGIWLYQRRGYIERDALFGLDGNETFD